MNERGNILVILLLAIILMGLLTMVIGNTQSGNNTIGKEKISIAMNHVQLFSNEIAIATDKLINQGISENDIEFSHSKISSDYGTAGGTDSNVEIFHIDGGQAVYKDPPKGINDKSPWEFTGGTAFPELGDEDSAELIAILPNVTQEFCDAINTRLDYDTSIMNPTDTGACILNKSDRFRLGNRYNDVSPNKIDETTVKYPFMEGCLACGDANHYVKVLIVR